MLCIAPPRETIEQMKILTMLNYHDCCVWLPSWDENHVIMFATPYSMDGEFTRPMRKISFLTVQAVLHTQIKCMIASSERMFQMKVFSLHWLGFTTAAYGLVNSNAKWQVNSLIRLLKELWVLSTQSVSVPQLYFVYKWIENCGFNARKSFCQWRRIVDDLPDNWWSQGISW